MAGEERCVCLSGRGRKGIYVVLWACLRSTCMPSLGGGRLGVEGGAAGQFGICARKLGLRAAGSATCQTDTWYGQHLVYNVRLLFLPFYSVQKKKKNLNKPKKKKKNQTLHLTNYGKIKPQISPGYGRALSLPGAPLPPCATTFPFSSNDLRKGAAQSLGLN